MPSTSSGEVLRVPDAETLADLATVAGRARRVDPDGAARLAAHGDVLTVTVCPVHGGGGPTVLGLRAVRMVPAGDLDVVVPLAGFAQALALPRARPDGGAEIVVPPERGAGVAWAGTSPPRGGWAAVGPLDGETLTARAAAGVAEIVAGSPPGSGAAAVATLRARAWGRPLVDGRPELDGLPAGVAFVAEALGFVVPGQPAVVYRAGPWWRVTTARGHVLARRPARV